LVPPSSISRFAASWLKLTWIKNLGIKPPYGVWH
jgi:hypothetical protein